MEKYIMIAIKEAKKCKISADIPVGAVIVENNKIIAKGHNTREKEHIITGHAEINAINKATKKKKNWHLNNCEMYVTLEPCEMCKNIIKQTKIKKVYYATKNHNIAKMQKNKIEIQKINDNGYSEKMLKNFFKKIRK